MTSGPRHRGAEKGRRQTSARTDLERRRRIAAWVAREVIAHEAPVRAWLARSRVSEEDIEELVQEAYCRLSMLDSVDHIDRADAYFFSIVRNLLVRRLRRQRVVPIDAIAEIESCSDDRQPSPEQEAGARRDYARMLDFMAALPERCRSIVMLRKIEGWSQKEIAAHFDMTEKAVEKQVWVGVKAIQRAWSEADRESRERLLAFENERRR